MIITNLMAKCKQTFSVSFLSIRLYYVQSYFCFLSVTCCMLIYSIIKDEVIKEF